MVGFSTVRFAFPVVVVLEFDSACRAVCDAYLLCSCEYLFSELFVFSGACSAHRYSLFFFSLLCVLLCCVRWWRVAASARRAPPPSNTTLCSFSFSSLLFFFLVFFLLSFLWDGEWRVVRAQPGEHARDTPLVLCFWVCLPCVACVTSTTM